MRAKACRKNAPRAAQTMSPIMAKLMPTPAAGPFTAVTIRHLEVPKTEQQRVIVVPQAGAGALAPGRQVRPGAEAAAGAGDEQAPHFRRARLERLEGVGEALLHVGTDRVEDFGWFSVRTATESSKSSRTLLKSMDRAP